MRVYKYCLDKDFVYRSKFDLGQFDAEFLDLDGRTITVKKGFRWDGCSPKFRWLDVYWGTPDGVICDYDFKPKTYWASCVHDVLYRYKAAINVSQLQVDTIFLRMLEDRGFYLAKLYFVIVRIFGKMYGEWKTKK